MVADMHQRLEAACLLTQKAASDLDAIRTGQHPEINSKLSSSVAKCFATDTAMSVTTDAVQIYGGYGYTKEYPVEKLMRDAKLIQIYEGTSQVQRLVIARELLK